MVAVLRITDGVDHADLLAPGAYRLRAWRPSKAPIKAGGVWQSSPLADGRRMVAYRWDNLVDTFTLDARGGVQDDLIQVTQDAERLLVKGMDYWASRWQNEPVWIEARSQHETNMRYALVKSYQFRNYSGPYEQPFTGCPPSFDELILVLEHGPWRSRPPCRAGLIQEGDFVPVGSADDADTDSGAGGTIQTAAINLTFGRDVAGDDLNLGIRFRNLGIPPGAAILRAYVTYVCETAQVGDDCSALIYGEQNVTPAVFSTYGDFAGRTRTDAAVEWHQVPHWVAGTTYGSPRLPNETPDIAPVIQEIVDLPGWRNGGDLVVFVEQFDTGGDDCSSASAFRQAASVDCGYFAAPVLHVDWLAEGDRCHDCVEIGATQLGAGPVEELASPWLSTDDADVQLAPTNAITLAGTSVRAGHGGAGGLFDLGVRFRDVDVHRYADIISAHVNFTETVAWAGVLDLDFFGEDNGTPATFSTFADFTGRVRTAATVAAWNPASGGAGTAHQTPDLRVVVQAVVNRGDWSAGGDMVVFCEDAGSAAGIFASFASWDDTTYDPPELVIEFVGEDGMTHGQTYTCENKVYVANKHNRANISHIFRASNATAGAVFSANLVGTWAPGISQNLFPGATVGNTECVYFGIQTSVPDSGPFCSLVFNIGVPAAYAGVAVNDGIIWEYKQTPADWNWAALTVKDKTWDEGDMDVDYQGPFNTIGVNSLHWIPPSDWADDDVNGVTGYWVRARADLAGGGTITMPTQDDQEIYSVLWPYVEVDADEVGGDIPALAQVLVTNQSYLSAHRLGADDVVVGLRSLSRGADYTPYINLANEQNPDGITVVPTGAQSNWIVDLEAPAGRAIQYIAPGVLAQALQIQAVITYELVEQYYGTFRCFLRCHIDAGTAAHLEITLLFRTYNIVHRTTATLSPPTANDWQVLDFGLVTLPAGMITAGDVMEHIYVDIYLECTNAAGVTATFYDLVLMPVDEWAGQFATPQGPFLGGWAGIALFQRRLEIDSVSWPKQRIRALVRGDESDLEDIMGFFQAIAPGEVVLQSNAAQRLWFLMARHLSSPEYEPRGWPAICSRIRVNAVQRYLGMRGAR